MSGLGKLLPIVLLWTLAEAAPPVEVQERSADGSGATIEGVVRGRMGEGLRPLPGAVVELEDARTVLADRRGAYRIAGLPPGEVRVHVHSIGYAPVRLDVRVPAGGFVVLDVELEVRPVALAPVHVEGVLPGAELATRGPAPSSLRGGVALRAAEATSGVAEVGLAAALGELGRGSDDPPTSALLVRGTAAEGKLVLLDGSPVYAPFHVGGLVSGFDADLLGRAEFHVGGAPSRYDGGLSYILDLRTRTPRGDRFRSSGAVDGLGVRGVLEGPLPAGTRVLAGGRMLHGLQPRLVDGVSSPYGYDDLLLRADTDLGPGHAMSTTVFRNREAVRLDGIGDVAPAWSGGEPAPSTARWGSGAVTSRYQGLWGATGVEIAGSVSEYEARLPFRLSSPYLASARQDRARGTADLGRAWGDGALRYGLAVERQEVGYAVAPLASAGGEEPLTGGVEGWVAGGYLDASRPLGDEFRVRAGLRADRFSVEGGFRLAPRLSLTWLLSETASLTLAGGRFHQYQAATGIGSEAELVARSRAAEWTPELFVSTANHLVVSLDQELLPGVHLELDGFLKRFDAGAPAAEHGRIHTSGVELRALREGERVDGWAGYALTWVWSQRGIEPTSEFLGRQLLNAGLEGRLTDRTRLAATISYGAGLPVSSIPMEAHTPAHDGTRTTGGVVVAAGESVDRFTDGRGDGAPLLSAGVPDDFLRLDVELGWLWDPSFGGRRTELRPYVRVLNALNRRDALFHLFDPWRSDDVRPLAERPLVPVLGVQWRF